MIRILLALTLALLWARDARAEGLEGNVAVKGDPVRCYSPGDDVYCLMANGSLRGLDSGRELMRLGNPGFQLKSMVCDVGPGPDAACLYAESQPVEGKPRSHDRLILERPSQQLIVAEGYAGNGFSAEPRGVFARNEHVAFAWRLGGKGLINIDEQVVEFPIREESTASRLATATGMRQQPRVEFFTLASKLWVVVRADNDLLVTPVDELDWARVAEHTMYDFRVVSGDDGWAYIFYHDYETDRAMVALSNDGAQWQSVELDEAESGWQLDAAKAGYGVACTWYYSRNTYNKGLRVAFLRNGQLLQSSHTILRNHDINVGWGPHLGVTRDGKAWFSWLDDVQNETRVWMRLDSVLDLADVRLRKYRDWRDRYKFWSLQAGAGSWYTLWSTFESAPDSKDTGGVKVGKVHRDLANSPLLVGSFEARFGRTQLALGYAQSILDKADAAGGRQLSRLSGALKFDKLFPGHDVQVRGFFGSYHGTATPGMNGDRDGVGTLRIDTRYWHAQALALNKWRIKYGFDYSRYTLPSTVSTWTAPAGGTSYGYTGSYFRSVSYDDIRFMLGYSKLDYVARYENHYWGPVIDIDGLVGMVVTKFPRIGIPNAQGADGALQLSFGAHADVGWLWMQRFRRLTGLGVYVRPLYRAEFDATLSGKPSDRDAKEAKSSSTHASVSLWSLRHGPWVDVGLVW